MMNTFDSDDSEDDNIPISQLAKKVKQRKELKSSKTKSKPPPPPPRQGTRKSRRLQQDTTTSPPIVEKKKKKAPKKRAKSAKAAKPAPKIPSLFVSPRKTRAMRRKLAEEQEEKEPLSQEEKEEKSVNEEEKSKNATNEEKPAGDDKKHKDAPGNDALSSIIKEEKPKATSKPTSATDEEEKIKNVASEDSTTQKDEEKPAGDDKKHKDAPGNDVSSSKSNQEEEPKVTSKSTTTTEPKPLDAGDKIVHEKPNNDVATKDVSMKDAEGAVDEPKQQVNERPMDVDEAKQQVEATKQSPDKSEGTEVASTDQVEVEMNVCEQEEKLDNDKTSKGDLIVADAQKEPLSDDKKGDSQQTGAALDSPTLPDKDENEMPVTSKAGGNDARESTVKEMNIEETTPTTEQTGDAVEPVASDERPGTFKGDIQSDSQAEQMLVETVNEGVEADQKGDESLENVSDAKDTDAVMVNDGANAKEKAVSLVDEAKVSSEDTPPGHKKDADSTLVAAESPLDLLAKIADTKAAPQSTDTTTVQGVLSQPSPLDLLASVAGNNVGASSVPDEPAKDRKEPKASDEVVKDKPEGQSTLQPTKEPSDAKGDDVKDAAPTAKVPILDKDDALMKNVSIDEPTAVVEAAKAAENNAVAPMADSSIGEEDSTLENVSGKPEEGEQAKGAVETGVPAVRTDGGETGEPMDADLHDSPVESAERKPQSSSTPAKEEYPHTQSDMKLDQVVDSTEVAAVSTTNPKNMEVSHDALPPENQAEKQAVSASAGETDDSGKKVDRTVAQAAIVQRSPAVLAGETIDAVLVEPPPVPTQYALGGADIPVVEQEGPLVKTLERAEASSEKTPASEVNVTNETPVVVTGEREAVIESPAVRDFIEVSVEPSTAVSIKSTREDVSGAVPESNVERLTLLADDERRGDAESSADNAVPMDIDATEDKAVPMDIDVTEDRKQSSSGGPGNDHMEIVPVMKATEENDDTVEQNPQFVTTQREKVPRDVGKVGSLKLSAEEDTMALLDAFPGMTVRKKSSESRSKKSRRKSLSIRLSRVPSGPENETPESAVEPKGVSAGPLPGLSSDVFPEEFSSKRETEIDSRQYDREFEDSLAFFSETHEDQDPIFVEFQHQKEKSRLKHELANLQKEFQAGMQNINAIIASQMNDKHAQADKNIEKLRNKQSMEEQKDLQRLQEAFGQKLNSHNNKMSQGIKLMTERQREQMQKAHRQHRQQAQQRGVSEQMASTEWGPIAQQLQAKQQQTMKEFHAKGEEMKKRYEADYQREKEKYTKHHEKRRQDLENTLTKVISKIKSGFQQQHQRYMKAHALRMKKRREELQSFLAESEPKQEPPSDAHADDKAVKPELRSPSPITLRAVPVDESEIDDSGAAARSKHRKGILGAVHKQLSVEIHNEGLWISILHDKSGDVKKTDSNNCKNNEFIPWGIKAREVLQSVMSGEIPIGYGTDRFDFGDVIAVQGGHIRCVVVDLRTSEETASAQRADALKEYDAESLKALQDKVEQLSRQVAEAEAFNSKAAAEEKDASAHHEKTLKDVEKAKGLMQHVRNKFKNLLGPDDVPLPSLSSSDRQKLSAAFNKYNSNLEAQQERLKAAETALCEKKVRSQKTMSLLRQTSKAATAASSSLKKKRAQMVETKSVRSRARLSETMESDRASTRVADVVGALRKVAESRQEQLNLKRSSAASSTYIQSLPGLPTALKKSLWHKMHRRRQQIVLRPNMDFVLSDMKESVEATAFYARQRSSSRADFSKEEISLRAEQLFLLSSFPEQRSKAPPSTPPSDPYASWAEPGWQINLEVPREESHISRSLLPRVPVPSLLQKNHSEVSSTPGKQVASLIKTTHLQALSTPLSSVAQAISLAETSSVAKDSKLSENDPLNLSNAAMTAGYSFALRSPAVSPSKSRRKSTPKVATPPTPSPVHAPPRTSASTNPKPGEAPLQPPPRTPSPLKRSTSTSSRKTTASTTTAAAAKTDKPAKPKRSRSKSSTVASPRAKASKKTADSTAAAAATASALDAASQARKYALQQQAAANAALYGQQRATAMEQAQAAQYSPSYMKQVAATQAANLQGLAPPQLQTTMAAQQQQLLPQPPYGSPSQQYQQQQRQLAQMRMMQQQGRAAGFPQQQAANMQFYPAAMQAAAARQAQSFSSAQAQGMAPIQGQAAQQQQQRRRAGSSSGGDDARNDPIFMLPDAPPPPPPKQPPK